MTGLLVSVRSAAEAQIALDAGADLIDVKEPTRGSLGAAEPAVWDEVRQVVAGRAPVSVALGELTSEISGRWADVSRNVQLAKLGLAGAKRLANWQARWLSVMASLPSSVEPVAVAYADWQTADAPAPHEVLQAAAHIPSPYLLVDTFDKSRGNLLAHQSLAQLAELLRQAAQHHMRLVLAGSLDAAAIARLLPLAPAYFAVRGAACAGERTQAIDAARVKRLASLVRTSVGTSAEEVA